jgi:hypothetical protein
MSKFWESHKQWKSVWEEIENISRSIKIQRLSY